MSTKNDGKSARANLWVTHQNLARAKSVPHYQPKQRKPVLAKKTEKPAADSAGSTEPQSADKAPGDPSSEV